MDFKNIRTVCIKSSYCVQPKSFYLQINSRCQTKAATKNESTAKTWCDFNNWNLQMQTATVSTRKQQLKQNHFDFWYIMKPANKKGYEPAVTEKGGGFNNCPTPPQQKGNELKTEKN